MPNHIIKYLILLQTILESVAQLPPRLGTGLNSRLSFTGWQEVEHLALVLLDVFAALFRGHVPRDFLVIVHAVTKFTFLITSA